MASKKAKKMVTRKASSRTVTKSPRKNVTGWKRFLLALGLSLILVIPLTSLVQKVNQAVLGVAIEAASR